jgi:formamidopyrimidine-DNA glycosylase
VPELPEVETVRRRLETVVSGARIEHATISDVRLTRPHDPVLLAAELVGERIDAVDRRGKYLVVRFASDRVLLVHLRMTGSFLWGSSAADPSDDPHRRAVLSMDNGSDVVYRDVRRFGTWELFEGGEVERHLADRLGPEPLGPITAASLATRLDGHRAPLKAVLLDQRVLAGLGNIYVDEALWWSRLHPQRPAGSLSAEDARRLHRAVRRVLRRAIERQGSTLRNYVTPDGERGSMQDEFHAYGRAGEPCDRCGTPLERAVVGGRGTTFCARCQRGMPHPTDARTRPQRPIH